MCLQNQSCTCFSCSVSAGETNRGVRPGSVGRKKGAAVGAVGGATGLFLLYKIMISIAGINNMLFSESTHY